LQETSKYPSNHISQLNTSMIGQNVFNFTNDKNSKDGNGNDSSSGILGDIGGDIENEFNKVKNKVENDIEKALNNVTGDVADELAKQLGVSEWYSVHVMDSCEGNYSPNATAKWTHLNVTNCTHSGPDSKLKLKGVQLVAR
jgi:hypothetical protein